jgi:hypothetical protein
MNPMATRAPEVSRDGSGEDAIHRIMGLVRFLPFAPPFTLSATRDLRHESANCRCEGAKRLRDREYPKFVFQARIAQNWPVAPMEIGMLSWGTGRTFSYRARLRNG